MQRRLVIAVLALSIVGAQAQPDTIAALKEAARTEVPWNIAKARHADVDCDGKSDTIMFGVGKKSVWIGVAPGSGGKARAMKFAMNPGLQEGLCAVPKSIDLSPINCNSDEYGPLPDCKPVKGCKAFSVDDQECDPLNFYWDGRHKTFRWWRN